MDEFLAVAKSLEIEELCNAETEKNHEPDYVTTSSSAGDQETTTKNIEEQTAQFTVPVSEERKVVVNVNGKYECDHCHKTYSGSGALYNHLLIHQGVKFACDRCDHQATRQGALKMHIMNKHEGVKYSCDQCDHQATDKSNLTRHIKRMHKGDKINHRNVQF